MVDPHGDWTRAAERLLFTEARCLDLKEWDVWVEMYDDDAIYWVPSWLNEYDLVQDPTTCVSFIYHESRKQLAERIARIESRKSITALPLPRTIHLISNVMVTNADDAMAHVQSCWTTHVYDPRTCKQNIHFGMYHHRIRRSSDRLLIAEKKIILMNDRVPTVLDFYSI